MKSEKPDARCKKSETEQSNSQASGMIFGKGSKFIQHRAWGIVQSVQGSRFVVRGSGFVVGGGALGVDKFPYKCCKNVRVF